jgi:excisionase family DNA binding protein
MNSVQVEVAEAEAYLTVDEVASQLKISRWKVYELIRSRELASFLVGRCRRIPASSVAELMKRLLQGAA